MFIIRENAQVQFGQFPQIQKEGNETRRGEATKDTRARTLGPA